MAQSQMVKRLWYASLGFEIWCMLDRGTNTKLVPKSLFIFCRLENFCKLPFHWITIDIYRIQKNWFPRFLEKNRVPFLLKWTNLMVISQLQNYSNCISFIKIVEMSTQWFLLNWPPCNIYDEVEKCVLHDDKSEHMFDLTKLAYSQRSVQGGALQSKQCKATVCTV